MSRRVDTMPDECMVEAAMEILGGKWKLAILRHLLTGTKRFGELHRAMPGITARMLTRQLRELETDRLVRRTVYPQVPPKVEYALTDIGESLRDITNRLDKWGRWYQGQADPSATAPRASASVRRRRAS